MRFPQRLIAPWRLVAVPLVLWLLLALTGAGGLFWQQQNSRESVAQRFGLRVNLMGDFVTSYAGDLIERERVQATTSLAGATVDARDFTRAVAGFGYPAAVLLDERGRALRVAPNDPSLIGQDLASRYAHLHTAVHHGRPAVSPVVASAARGQPVVAFAVPFNTAAGRRVFSGAVDVRRSPLSAYLLSAMSLSGARVQLVDDSGGIVAANQPLRGAVPTIASHNDSLAAALQRRAQGRYHADGRWWRYSSVAIRDTPWQLSAAVPEDVLFGSLADNERVGQAALGGAAAVGLLVVAAAGRARRSRRDHQLSEHRFRRIFDSSRIGMVLTDIHGRFVRVNAAANQLFGRTEPDLIGKFAAEVSHPEDSDAAKNLMQDCLSGRIDGFDLDKRYLQAEGRVIDASVTTALLRDGGGQPQYFATQIIDMTEHRALEQARRANEAELAQRAEQLQDINAHLADFMAMLSHDLRQPLSTVIGLGELLLDDWATLADEEKHRDVQRMTTAGHRAGNLITDILTLAQLDAGALVARPTRIDLSHAVREAVTAHQAAEPTPVTVVAPDQADALADAAHLQLILGNLLANATKYGRPPITVTVTNRRDQILINVTDHGEGVPAGFVPHLFDRFARADSGVAVTAKGTGLGLYLVRQLANAGGLDVSYQPNQPTGATFTVSVPCVTPKTANVHLLRPTPTHQP
jgi:PAS domain S-box-containing protein